MESSSKKPEKIPEKAMSVSRNLSSQILTRQVKKQNLAKDRDLVKKFTFLADDLQELDKHYKEALGQLLNSFKRAAGNRKKQYEELVEVITHAYLDKLVISNPKKLSEETKKVLEDVAEKLKKAKFNSSDLIKKWEEKYLKDVLTASSSDEIKKFFT